MAADAAAALGPGVNERLAAFALEIGNAGSVDFEIDRAVEHEPEHQAHPRQVGVPVDPRDAELRQHIPVQGLANHVAQYRHGAWQQPALSDLRGDEPHQQEAQNREDRDHGSAEGAGHR